MIVFKIRFDHSVEQIELRIDQVSCLYLNEKTTNLRISKNRSNQVKTCEK